MEQPKPRRPIPRVLMVLVPLVTLGLALIAVGVAWRSGRPEQPAPSPDAVGEVQVASEAFLGCTDCHGDLDKVFKQGGVPNLLYRHAVHFDKGVSDCSVCHPANTHEPDKINRPTMSRCFICHGLEKNAIAPGACTTCHPKDMSQIPSSHLEDGWLPAGHAEAALEDNFECLTCHEQATCDSCHRLEMPHEEAFTEETHPVVYFEDPQLCANCHPQPVDRPDDCDTCHHSEGPEDAPWVEFHPTAVKDLGAGTCFQCHADQTCRTCHGKGIEDISADQALFTAAPPVTPPPPSGPTGG
jgi:hypothetical protein